MKQLLLITLVVAVCFGASHGASIRVKRQPQRGGLIPADFRNIKIDDYLKNQRAVAFQLKCIVYDGPCDRIGKYLKVTIPDLITGTCSQCTPSDRMIAGKLVSHIQKNFPKEWHDAVKKFQGGQTVKPEDASRLEALLGVKIESDLVAATTAAPAPVAVEAAVPAVATQPAAPVAVAPAAPVAVAPAAPVAVAPAAPVTAAVAPIPAVSEPVQPAVVAAPVPAVAVAPVNVAVPQAAVAPAIAFPALV